MEKEKPTCSQYLALRRYRRNVTNNTNNIKINTKIYLIGTIMNINFHFHYSKRKI